MLAEVDRPLRVELWHRRGERQRGLDLLELMRDHSPHLSFELVDLDRNPQRAKDHGVDHYDRAVLSYDGREVVVGDVLILAVWIDQLQSAKEKKA